MGGTVSIKLLLLLPVFLLPAAVSAEFNDPMRPPEFAMKKFKLEKAKSKGNASQKVVKKQVKASPWVLSSILYSDQRKHAIINNTLVKQGDVIKGARLIRLRPNGVQLLNKGKIIDLTLGKSSNSVKKIPSGRRL